MQERCPNPAIPEPCPVVQLSCRLPLRNDARNLPKEGRVGPVVKRAQHSGDVAQGGILDATLADGPPGISFEIDEDEVFPGKENLSQMKVAVNSGSHGGN